MKIDFNPHAAAQAQKAQAPQTQTTPPAPEVSDDGVEITLSQAAKQLLKGDATYEGNSPAHQARAAMLKVTADQDVAGLTIDDQSKPFGQIVKMFAHAKHAPEPTEPADGGGTGDTGGTTETGGTGETGETGVTTETSDTGDTSTTEDDDTTVVVAPDDGDTTVVDDTDPVIVVEEPDITEILDDSEPADGETSESGSSEAGSGDAVASTGDDESGDGGTTESAPAVVADAGDVTGELLDLLDETGEEAV